MSLPARPAAARMKVSACERVNGGDTAATDRARTDSGRDRLRPRPTGAQSASVYRPSSIGFIPSTLPSSQEQHEHERLLEHPMPRPRDPPRNPH